MLYYLYVHFVYNAPGMNRHWWFYHTIPNYEHSLNVSMCFTKLTC